MPDVGEERGGGEGAKIDPNAARISNGLFAFCSRGGDAGIIGGFW